MKKGNFVVCRIALFSWLAVSAGIAVLAHIGTVKESLLSNQHQWFLAQGFSCTLRI